MNNTAEELADAEESDRPTWTPPPRVVTRQVDTSDVDATWPGETPRHSFIVQRRDLQAGPPEAKSAAPAIDDSGIIKVEQESAPPAYAPPMDAYEDERALLVFIDMPGVTSESLTIELSNVALYVRATVPDDPKRLSPLTPGRREVVIDVPRGIEAEAVDASLRNGLLRIRVDKSGVTTRHVEIAHPPE